MDAESPVLPVMPSKDPHSLEDAARTALGTWPDDCNCPRMSRWYCWCHVRIVLPALWHDLHTK